jgi:O-antigen/teichoic acid export membrane protein
VTLIANPTTRDRVRSFLRGSGALAIAIVVMNVATYGFQIIAARRLGPEQYGGIASLMALLLVLGVVQLGLQATAARRVASAPGHVAAIERTITSVTARASLAVGALMLVLSPLVWKVLQLDSIVPALLVAVSVVPMTVTGGQAGILQGERRWLPLSILYLALGIPRVIIGTACILVRPTESAAMLGVTLSLFVPAVIGWWALRRHPRGSDATADPADLEEHAFRRVATETLHSSVALLAFFVLSNLDIVVARNTLSHHQAGLYAGGLILTKAVLFLPQFVVVVAFPAMSTAGERRRSLVQSLIAVAGVGVISTLGAWLLSGLAMIFIGGAEYQAVQHRLWLFAVVGTMLAMLQMLVYGVLARQHRGAAYLVWAAAIVLAGVGLTMGTLTHLVLTVVAVDTVLTAILLAVSLWHLREDVPEPL